MTKWFVFTVCFYVAVVNALNISDCPSGLPHDGYLKVFNETRLCYRFVVNQPLKFWRSEMECEKHGGTLVIIKSKMVNDFIWKTLYYDYNIDYATWIGLSDKEKEAHFVWMDKTQAINHFLNWDLYDLKLIFHPNVNKDCVVMEPASGGWIRNGGLWQVRECDHSDIRAPYVCQYRPVKQLINATTATPTTIQATQASTRQTTIPATQAPTILATTTTPQKATTQASSTHEKPTQASTKQTPTTQAPTTQASSTHEKTTQASTKQIPTTQAPTTQGPKTNVPTTKTPTAHAPKTQAPTTQAPTTHAPTTQAPTKQAPPTQAPTTHSPSTQAPPTLVLTTQAPKKQTPPTRAPKTEAPTTQTPTTQTPTTQAPLTQAPITKAPKTKDLVFTPIPTCAPFTCDLDCGMDGYSVDARGCTLCKCDA